MAQKRIEPGPGQESVWDYPRPPRLEDSSRQLCVVFNGQVIAKTNRSKRVLETSHPPVYYFPPEDVQVQYLHATPRTTFCEWKGRARYYSVMVGDRTASNAAWTYPDPTGSFQAIKNYIAFYPLAMDVCTVDGEKVRPQPGGFYGGWITADIAGPFKGDPGTDFW